MVDKNNDAQNTGAETEVELNQAAGEVAFVEAPGPDEAFAVEMEIGMNLQIEGFDTKGATFIQDSANPANLIIIMPNGGQIVLENFLVMAQTGLPPFLTLADGTVITAQETIALIEDLDLSSIQTAAGGPQAGGTGGAFAAGGAGFEAAEYGDLEELEHPRPTFENDPRPANSATSNTVEELGVGGTVTVDASSLLGGVAVTGGTEDQLMTVNITMTGVGTSQPGQVVLSGIPAGYTVNIGGTTIVSDGSPITTTAGAVNQGVTMQPTPGADGDFTLDVDVTFTNGQGASTVVSNEYNVTVDAEADKATVEVSDNLGNAEDASVNDAGQSVYTIGFKGNANDPDGSEEVKSIQLDIANVADGQKLVSADDPAAANNLTLILDGQPINALALGGEGPAPVVDVRATYVDEATGQTVTGTVKATVSIGTDPVTGESELQLDFNVEDGKRVQSFDLTPSGENTGLQIALPTHSDDNLDFTVKVETAENPTDGEITDSNNTAVSDPVNFSLEVQAVADGVSIAPKDDETGVASGDEDTSISIPKFDVTLRDNDGSEGIVKAVLKITDEDGTIDDVTAALEAQFEGLSAVLSEDGKTLTITMDDGSALPNGLGDFDFKVSPNAGSDKDISMQLEMTTKEINTDGTPAAGKEEITHVEPFTVNVNPVIDTDLPDVDATEGGAAVSDGSAGQTTLVADDSGNTLHAVKFAGAVIVGTTEYAAGSEIIVPNEGLIVTVGETENPTGVMVINKDGTWSFTPDSQVQHDAEGDGSAITDTFQYKVADSEGDLSDWSASQDINVGDTVPLAMSQPKVSVTEGDAATEVSKENGLLSDDTLGADGGSVTTFSIGGQTYNAGETANVANFGALKVNADGSWSFTPLDSVTHGADGSATDDAISNSFTYVVEDSDGDTSSATQEIEVKDTGVTANDDTAPVINEATGGTSSGNVLTNDTVGQDEFEHPGLTVEGKVVEFTYVDANGVTQTAAAGTSVTTEHGTFQLNEDGSYTYQLGDANNDGKPSADHTASDSITDSITYKMTDKDGDTATADLDITINDDNTISAKSQAKVSVTEGDAIKEISAADGLLSDDTIGVDGGEVTTFSVGGQTYNAGQTATITGFGDLKVNADGSWSFDPVDAATHGADGTATDDAISNTFTYTIKDADGDTSSATQEIEVKDTGVTANDDTAPVINEATGGTSSGNVLTNDTVGQDEFEHPGLTVEGKVVEFTYVDANGVTQTAAAGTSVTTEHGTFQLNEDGSYTYQLGDANNDGKPSADHTASDSITDSITYKMTDKDGDTAMADLDITINDDNTISAKSQAKVSVTEGDAIKEISAADGLLSDDTIGVDGGEVTTFSVGGQTYNAGQTATITGFGDLKVNADGSWSFDPVDAATHGADGTATDDAISNTFTYTIKDADGDTSSATQEIEVKDTGVTANDDTAPVINEATGGTSSGNVLTNDTVGQDEFEHPGLTVEGKVVEFTYVDANGVTQTAAAGTSVTTEHGTFQLNEDGSYTYQLGDANNDGKPSADHTASDSITDSITYKMTDKDGDTATADLDITINDDNTISAKSQAKVSVTEGDAIKEISAADGLLSDDTIGVDGGEVTTFSVGGQTYNAGQTATIAGFGDLKVNADGSWSFDPVDAATHGADGTATDDAISNTFTYTIKDADGDTSSATQEIEVKDTAPSAPAEGDTANFDELDGDASVAQDKTFNIKDFGATFGQDGLQTLTATIEDTTPNGYGTPTIKSVDPVTGDIVVSFPANYNGDFTINYSMTDKDGDQAQSSIDVTVDPVNDAPVAINDAAPNVSPTGLTGTFYSYDKGMDNHGNIINTMKAYIAANDPNATFTATDLTFGSGNGTLNTVDELETFLEDDGASVQDQGLTEQSAGLLHLTGGIALNEGSHTISVRADDGYSIVIKGAGENGADIVIERNVHQAARTHNYDIDVAADGVYEVEIIYWDQGGAYTFDAKLDGQPIMNSQLYPDVVNSKLVTMEDKPLTIDPADLLANDTDVDNQVDGTKDANDGLSIDPNGFTPGAGVQSVTMVNGEIIVTPLPDHNGPATFTYTVTDGSKTDTATVTIGVLPVNDAPTAGPLSVAAVDEDDANITFTNDDILAQASDKEGAVKVVDVTVTKGSGTLSSDDNGNWTFNPADNYTGQVEFKYTVADSEGTTASSTITSTVNPVDDLVVANDDVTGKAAGLTGTFYSYDRNIDNHGNIVQTMNAYANDNPAHATFTATQLSFVAGSGTMNTVGELETFLGSNGTITNDAGMTAKTAGLIKLEGGIEIAAGTHTLTIRADDGYSVVINGEVVAERNVHQAARTHEFTFDIAESGTHNIQVIYWDQGGAYTFDAKLDGQPIGGSMLTHGGGVEQGTEETALEIPVADLLQNDVDIDGDVISIKPDGFSFNSDEIQSITLVNGVITVVPAKDFNGATTFTYTAEANGTTDTATVSLNFSPTNDAPTAIALDSQSVDENDAGGVIGKLSTTDVDDTSFTYKVMTETSPGVWAEDARFTVDASGNLKLADGVSFDHEQTKSIDIKVEVTDNGGGEGVAKTFDQEFTIEIDDVNETPLVNGERVITNDTDGTVLVPAHILLANDADTDNADNVQGDTDWQNLSISSAMVGSNAQFAVPAEGGSANYTVSDGDKTADATVDFTVQAGDQVVGTNDADIIVGRDVTDTIVGGRGDDYLVGHGGDDVFKYNYGDGSDKFDGGEGFDSIDAKGAFRIEISEMSSVEKIEGTGFSIIHSDGGELDFTDTELAGIFAIRGDETEDHIKGSSQTDNIYGHEGADTLEGNAGADFLSGDEGMDKLLGGENNDILYGGAEADELFGGEGNDLLEGDRLSTQQRTHEVDGVEGGDDILDGGAGNDTLNGGEGDDRLTGGTGDDTFVYNAMTDGHDLITDYSEGDTIDLDALFDDLNINTADREGRVIQDGNKLQIDADGDGQISGTENDFSISFDNDVTLDEMDIEFGKFEGDVS